MTYLARFALWLRTAFTAQQKPGGITRRDFLFALGAAATFAAIDVVATYGDGKPGTLTIPPGGEVTLTQDTRIASLKLGAGAKPHMNGYRLTVTESLDLTEVRWCGCSLESQYKLYRPTLMELQQP